MTDDNRIDFPKAAANDAKRQMPDGPLPAPELLKVPDRFQSVAEVLACAQRMNLLDVIVLSETEEGNLVLLHHGLDRGEMNFLLDRLKLILLDAVEWEKVK